MNAKPRTRRPYAVRPIPSRMRTGRQNRSGLPEGELRSGRSLLAIGLAPGIEQGDLRVDSRVMEAVLGGDELYELIGPLDVGCAILQRPRGGGRPRQRLRRASVLLERHHIL